MTLEEFKKAYDKEIEACNAAIRKRENNMFLGPVGFEERISIMRDQLNMAHWAIMQLTNALLAERAAPQELDSRE